MFKRVYKKYEIKKLTLTTLEEVAAKLGYSIIKYNNIFNNEYVDKLIKGLKIKEDLENNYCFTFKTEHMSYIFVREGMQEQALIPMLLHELGHIYLNHTDGNVVDRSALFDCEANDFAFKIQFYLNQNRLKRKALYIVTAFLLSALVIGTVALNFKNNKSNEFEYYQEVQETSTAITEVTLEPTTEAITENLTETTIEPTTELTTEPTPEETTKAVAEHEENNNVLYYVSTSGTKYHLESCYHINPDRCIALTLEEVLEKGYSPCKTCRPNELN